MSRIFSRLPLRAAFPLAAALVATAATAQGLPKIERSFANGSTLRLYGQINKGVLQYDDGIDSETYGLIDNDNSGTRFGLRYTQERDGWTFENVDEFKYAPYSSSNASILNDSPSSADYEFTNANIRKLDFTLKSDRYGKVWLGQGSMATDGIEEIDLSGTDVVAYSSVADSAGGQIIRFRNPALSFDQSLSGITIADAFTNYDGPRRVRLRYDTPSFHDLTFATSYGRNLLSDDSAIREQNIADASLTYDHTFDTVELQAGVGYYWQENSTHTWGASASALHAPTGLNLTLATGQDTGSGGSYWYGKLGVLRPKLISWGATAASIDYYSGDDFYLDADAGITSSTSTSWGIGLVQTIERANTQLWLTWRKYDYSDNTASYDNGQALFGGARFTF